MPSRANRFIRQQRAGLTALLVAAFCIGGARHGQDAEANGDTRTLNLYHTHTHESAQITFMRDGVYDREALQKLNWLLRDWRKDEPIAMDPHLFDLVWAAYREVGSREPIQVVSAYRSPGTNAMLRRRSRAVAKHSQHMAGKAMDFHLTDVSMARVREVGIRLQYGGVGYYPTAGTPFVHLDTGAVRHWPRVTRDYLARLFPDGKTVHIPADGHPMAHYAEAAAEIEARGGQAIALAEVNTSRGKSFWASLFGGAGEDDEEVAPVARGRGGRGRTVVASAQPQQLPGDDTGARSFLLQSAGQDAAPQAAPAPVPQPLPATALQATPDPAAAQPEAPAAVIAAAVPPVVPLPPEKPVILAALENKVPDPASLLLAEIPLPPARPTAEAAALLLADIPLPPLRAAGPAPAGAPAPPALMLASAPASLPDASAYAAAPQVPLPPLRAVQPPAVTRTTPPQLSQGVSQDAEAPALRLSAEPAERFGVPLDRQGLASLMSQVAVQTAAPARPLKVAAPSVAVAAGGGVAVGRFARTQPAVVAAGHFNGPAVRPLNVRVLRPTPR